jgi:hypothetical protein
MILQLEPVNAEGRARFRCDECGLVTTPLRPEYIHKLSCRCPRKTPVPPGILQAAANFTRAAAVHIATGAKTAPDEVREQRLSICQACHLFNGTACTHKQCGCSIKEKRGFIDKLSWASSKCPLDPPKWTAHTNT